jgi:hypothetical protein
MRRRPHLVLLATALDGIPFVLVDFAGDRRREPARREAPVQWPLHFLANLRDAIRFGGARWRRRPATVAQLDQQLVEKRKFRL